MVSSASSQNLIGHLNQFCSLGGFSKKMCLVFKMLWLAVVSIIWKERNRRIFQHKEEHILSMDEQVKLLVF